MTPTSQTRCSGLLRIGFKQCCGPWRPGPGIGSGDIKCWMNNESPIRSEKRHAGMADCPHVISGDARPNLNRHRLAPGASGKDRDTPRAVDDDSRQPRQAHDACGRFHRPPIGTEQWTRQDVSHPCRVRGSLHGINGHFCLGRYASSVMRGDRLRRGCHAQLKADCPAQKEQHHAQPDRAVPPGCLHVPGPAGNARKP